MIRLASLLVALCVAFGYVGGAPVPQPNKVKGKEVKVVPPHVGTWNMDWNGESGRTTFHADGGYQCDWDGENWIGGWRIVDGVLYVEELVQPQNGNPQAPIRWAVYLDQTGRAGKVDDETMPSFRLTVLKPDA